MTHVQFISFLFELEINLHIAHLQTQSFAEHKALDEAYSGVHDFRDGYAELCQKDEILKGYTSPTIRESISPLLIVKKAIEQVTIYRKGLTASNMQNEVDNLLTLLETTHYKLKFLK